MKNAELWKRIASRQEIYDGFGYLTHQECSWLVERITVSTIMLSPFKPFGKKYFDDEENAQDFLESPRMLPPFDDLFIEYNHEEDDDPNYRSASFAHSVRSHDGCTISLFQLNCVGGDSEVENPRCVGRGSISLDKGGEIVPGSFGATIPSGAWGEHQRLVDVQNHLEAIQFGALFDVLAMLSCKNVSLAPREVRERSKFAAKRHGGEPHPAFRYHVLVVRPPGARSESHPGIEIGTMPLHVCRGHFKEYTADRPLFGRAGMHGRFFIPPHMRGDKKNGIVEKDYEVRAAV